LTPAWALFGLLAITAVAAARQFQRRCRQAKRLCRFARQWEMHYSRDDRFKLVRRMSNPLPQPGAADLRVVDVLFATHHHRHLYIFTIQYSLGALTGIHRHARAAAIAEPVHRGAIHEAAPMQLTLAPENLPLLRQYQSLHDSVG